MKTALKAFEQELNAIRETKDLSKETEALLNKAITTRVAEFLQNQ